MGNISSCFNAKSKAAKLIDLRGNVLRHDDVSVTAAEIMLEKPGHVVAVVSDLRLSAVKADETLSAGNVYILIPVSRVNGKLSESEIADIALAGGRRSSKRRSSRVLPVVAEVSGEGSDNPVKVFGEESDSGILGYRMKQWKPSLEPICEGI